MGTQSLKNIIIEDVSSFVYLGSKLTWDNDCMEDMKRRIQLATGAYSGLKIVWKDKNIRLETKVYLLQTCVFSVLLYAAEFWTISKEGASRTNAFRLRCYKWLLNIRWHDHITNDEVKNRVRCNESLSIR